MGTGRQVQCQGKNSLRIFDCPPQLLTDGLCTSADVRREHANTPVGDRPLVASLGTHINFSRPNSSDLLVSDLSPIKPRHSFTSFASSPIDGPDGGYRHDPFVGTGQIFTHSSRALHELTNFLFLARI